MFSLFLYILYQKTVRLFKHQLCIIERERLVCFLKIKQEIFKILKAPVPFCLYAVKLPYEIHRVFVFPLFIGYDIS